MTISIVAVSSGLTTPTSLPVPFRADVSRDQGKQAARDS